MNMRRTAATARRILRQLRRDPRTVALLFLTPVILVALVKWVFDGQPAVFQRVGVPLLGIFPLVSMFLVTSIAMLRERTSGTLERLMTTPIGRVDLLAGYAIAFGLMAALQATVVALVAFGLLSLSIDGPIVAVIAMAILNSLLGMSLGLFLSAFASSEFQAVQFMPAFMFPQILLCGLLAPRDHMAKALEWISRVLPMTYAYDALDRVARDDLGGRLSVDALVVFGATVAALLLASATLRRHSA
jgi:ABC-2 type transport system permease protein